MLMGVEKDILFKDYKDGILECNCLQIWGI